MTTVNDAPAEQLSLIENPPAASVNSQPAQNAGSPTKSVKSERGPENGEAMDSLIIPPETSESQCKRACYIVIAIFLFCVFAGAIVILAFLILRVGGQPPVVWTTCGKLQGVFNFQKNHFSFTGVPFALPPVDQRRWQPPVLMSNVTGHCWPNDTEIRDASRPAPQCVQKDIESGGTAGSEDCLYLNIFTPRVGQARLPVVVWIHGGDFDTGNASIPGFSPDGDLAKEFGVVFVSIQFRLNAFGFLVIKELPNNPGNLGLLDQIAALKWIKENIANFGGDPDQVTIFGQGSGGSSVLALMVAPRASGLFHKAWAASPSVFMNTTLESARTHNAFFVNETGCLTKDDVKQCLLSLTDSDVLHTVFTKWTSPNSNSLPTADENVFGRLVVDGNILPSKFIDAFKRGSQVADVPLLIGSTAQEVDYHPEPIKIGKEDNSSYVRIIETHLGKFKEGENLTRDALLSYPYKPNPDVEDAGGELALTSLVSDIRVNCPVNNIAELATASLKSPVYRYVVTIVPSKPMHSTRSIYDAKYAFHELDLMAYFETMNFFFSSGGGSNADELFSSTFRDNARAFIKTAQPLDQRWVNFNTSTALIDQTITIVDKYHNVECNMLESHDLLRYGWRA